MNFDRNTAVYLLARLSALAIACSSCLSGPMLSVSSSHVPADTANDTGERGSNSCPFPRR